MSFNLIHEKWIPIRRRDGTQELIAPWEITENLSSNPILALDAPRPDFNGALIQFLIGLVQTTMASENDRAWRKSLTQPPRPSQLRERFESVAFAFDLDGDGARFMQDLNLSDGEEKEIATLLIEAPGDNTLRNNTDFFIKRGIAEQMCFGLCCNCSIRSSDQRAQWWRRSPNVSAWRWSTHDPYLGRGSLGNSLAQHISE